MANDRDFLLSCIKSADSERDIWRERYESLVELVKERAGEQVWDAWYLQLVADRAAVYNKPCTTTDSYGQLGDYYH